MILKDFQQQFISELSHLYPKTEILSFFYILIDEYLNLKKIDLVTNPTLEVTNKELETLGITLKRLKEQEPIQYIIGKAEFYGLPFDVTKNVLIPRPETEELVEWILQIVASTSLSDSIAILDIGTGSGCIPITLKKHLPKAQVSSIDVSEEALEVAKQNALKNEVDINFIQQDILNTSLDQKYDIIVSNPPYVRELEKAEIKKNVLDNEPELALFVDDNDPLIFYKKITQLSKHHLNKNGLLFFEINQYLGKEMLDVLRLYEFKNVLLKKDLFGNDRMLKASI